MCSLWGCSGKCQSSILISFMEFESQNLVRYTDVEVILWGVGSAPRGPKEQLLILMPFHAPVRLSWYLLHIDTVLGDTANVLVMVRMDVSPWVSWAICATRMGCKYRLGLPLQLSMFYNYTGLTLYYYYRLSAHTNMTLWWQDYWTSSTSTSCLSLMWMDIVSAGLRYCRFFCWSFCMCSFEGKLFLEGKHILHVHFIAFFGIACWKQGKEGKLETCFFHLQIVEKF